GIQYTTEFHMTNDSKLFPPRGKWEEDGYRADEYGHWLKGKWRTYDGPKHMLERDRGVVVSNDGSSAIALEDIEDVALPLYQGAMIHQFDFCAAGYRKAAGSRGFKWEPLGWDEKRFEPQYLMSGSSFSSAEGTIPGAKFGFRNVARTTDSRTFIAAAVP